MLLVVSLGTFISKVYYYILPSLYVLYMWNISCFLIFLKSKLRGTETVKIN